MYAPFAPLRVTRVGGGCSTLSDDGPRMYQRLLMRQASTARFAQSANRTQPITGRWSDPKSNGSVR